jgi:OmcA/MtrC family decaheme c-type cytochrome
VGTPVPTGTLPPPRASGQAGAGLASSISNVSIDSTGLIIATFTLTDAAGIPITPVLQSTTDEQLARVRLVISHVEDYTETSEGGVSRTLTRYVNDINATSPALDSKGTLQAVDPAHGVYQYIFGTHLAAGFDPSRTYTVGMQVDRFFGGVRLGINPIFDLVPAGGTPEIFESTTTQQCNQCHDPLIAHGNRREVRLCMLCHTEAATDPQGHTIDFRNMIHKIHRGKDLPSIVNGPPGSMYAINNTVFAQKDANGVITGVGFPRAIEGCTVCHAQGPTASYYKDRAAIAPCTSCHDDVNPSLKTTAAGPSGINHVASKGFDEAVCTVCHVADTGSEFDFSVVGTHVIPERSVQLAGLNVTITGITNNLANANTPTTPTIAFTVTNSAGKSLALSDVTKLDRLGFAMSGPSTDNTVMLTATAVGGGAAGTLSGPDANGVFRYVPPASFSIPAGAGGTWTIGAEARRMVTLPTIVSKTFTANEASPNSVVPFAVDNSTVAPRRVAVDNSHCGGCHGEFSKDFSVHGNLRNQTTYCVVCHNPNQTDAARRKQDPAAVARGDQTASIDFKRLIHQIHTGDQREHKPFLIYGFGPPPAGFSITDFADVRFPGDRRDCAKCHRPGTYLIPPYPGTALGTLITHLDPATGNEVQDGRLGPIRSVCTACHDADVTVAHAETQTAPDGTEACPVCHEEGVQAAISVVHAGRN